MKTCISTLPSPDSRLAAIAGRLAPAVLAVLGLCAAAAAQQPYQMPTALGPVVLTSGSSTATISEPIEAVGKTILARRTLNTTAQLGTYSTDATQGPSFFSAFVSGTRATNITDPHLERGVNSTTRFYCTEAGPSGRLLQQITTGVTVTLATLPTTPSSNWRLQAVSRTNSRFVLYDAGSGKIARYDASLSPAFLVLGTLAGADGFSLSPNGQRIVSGCLDGNLSLWDAASAQRAVDQGASLITCGSDHSWLVQGVKKAYADSMQVARRALQFKGDA